MSSRETCCGWLFPGEVYPLPYLLVVKVWTLTLLSDRCPYSLGIDRQLGYADSVERVGDCVRDRARSRDDWRLTDALGTEWSSLRWNLNQPDVERRDLIGLRQAIVHQTRVEWLAALVIDQPFMERPADPLGRATHDLPSDHRRVERRADVLDRHELQELHVSGLRIDPHMRDLPGEARRAILHG